jgi:hypothetical protein
MKKPKKELKCNYTVLSGKVAMNYAEEWTQVNTKIMIGYVVH